MQDGERRRRRSHCTRSSSRRARRNEGLRGQWSDVKRRQQSRRYIHLRRPIALLPLVAMLGAEVCEIGVDRTSHLGAGDGLISGNVRDALARLIAGRYRQNTGHVHYGTRRKAGTGVGRHRDLREQNHADQRSANAAQEAASHAWPPGALTRPAGTSVKPRARGRSAEVRLMDMGHLET